MRTLLLASIAVFSFAHLAQAQNGPTFSKMPPTEAFLRQLDNEQLAILRTAAKGCANPGALTGQASACVIMRTDEGVMKSGNPDLETFHKALPLNMRYDESRDDTLWRAWAIPK